jgi:UDP-N-acetylmuramoyl-L-alanyl-D-glutamate--2,6-diaminopimelate ligase
VIGTIGYRLGRECRPAPHTTPQAPDLQALLRWMADGGAGAVAMEVSSHALEQHRVDGTRFAFALFTNLSQDHLDYHGDFETYYQAKRRLFTDFAPGAAVINLDDPWGRRLAGECPVETITFGTHPDSIIRIAESTLGRDGVRVALELPGGRLELTSPMVGAHNVQNIVAAAALGWIMGLPMQSVVDGIAGMRLVPGRMEKVSREGEPLVLVDYAHTPDALEKLIAGARPLVAGKLVLVFGCGGDRDRTKRPLMGGIAARGADLTIITSDNPRSEDPGTIIEAVVEGYRSVRPDGVETLTERSQAIARAVELAGPDDVVLIAGKGHEPYQILGLKVIDFDDRLEARKALDASTRRSG